MTESKVLHQHFLEKMTKARMKIGVFKDKMVKREFVHTQVKREGVKRGMYFIGVGIASTCLFE